MSPAPWIILGLIAVLAIAASAAYKLRNRKKRETDYLTFFIIGLFWVPIGIFSGNHFFTLIGFAFMVLGLLHKEKWKQNAECWKNLRMRKFGIISLILGLLIAVLIALYLRMKI